MNAFVRAKYGSPDVLQVEEVEKPTPKDKEVLVKIYAASVNVDDLEHLRGTIAVRLIGPLKPKYKILGSDIAGRIEAVGRNVQQFQPGDAVFGDLTDYGFGAFAEYVCVPENALVLKSASMTFEEASTVTSRAAIAVKYLRAERPIQPGHKILINGAGGGVGTFAVQIAKYYGADVTGVDSAGKLDMLRSIGADHVIDYTKEDFTESGETYNVIFDAVGKMKPSGKKALKKTGIYVNVLKDSGSLGKPARARQDLTLLKEICEAGKFKAVIDRRYPLEQTAEAHRYVEKGHKKGNVVITV